MPTLFPLSYPGTPNGSGKASEGRDGADDDDVDGGGDDVTAGGEGDVDLLKSVLLEQEQKARVLGPAKIHMEEDLKVPVEFIEKYVEKVCIQWEGGGEE